MSFDLSKVMKVRTTSTSTHPEIVQIIEAGKEIIREKLSKCEVCGTEIGKYVKGEVLVSPGKLDTAIKEFELAAYNAVRVSTIPQTDNSTLRVESAQSIKLEYTLYCPNTTCYEKHVISINHEVSGLDKL